MNFLTSLLFLNMPPAVGWTLTAIVSIVVFHVILTTIFNFSVGASIATTVIVVGGILGLVWYLTLENSPSPPRTRF